MTELLAADEPVDVWRKDHDHGLHTIAAMSEAIAKDFIIRETCEAPYLYRYLVPVLPETPQATDFLESVFKEEARLGATGAITLIGRRIVGSP